MPILPPTIAATIQGHFLSLGWVGVNMPVMATAIGTGAGLGMIGATFATSDVGLGPTPGVGAGVGVIADEAGLSAALFAGMVAKFPPGGDDLQDFCDGVAKGIVLGLATAALTSVHPLCFSGVGSVNAASGGFVFVGSTISSGIQGLAPFTGDSWPDIAEVIGTEIQNAGTSTMTGQVTITGAPPPPPASPIPCPPGTSGTGAIA